MNSFKIILDKDAIAPSKGSEHAAGWDLYSTQSLTLRPGKRESVKTGLTMELPKGYFGSIRPRSGLAVRHGIDTLAGVIDCDYRGEVCVVLINLGGVAYHIEKGDRIAQMIIQKYYDMNLMAVDKLEDTERSNKGFGSSGV